jgi:hypothetical protein
MLEKLIALQHNGPKRKGQKGGCRREKRTKWKKKHEMDMELS